MPAAFTRDQQLARLELLSKRGRLYDRAEARKIAGRLGIETPPWAQKRTHKSFMSDFAVPVSRSRTKKPREDTNCNPPILRMSRDHDELDHWRDRGRSPGARAVARLADGSIVLREFVIGNRGWSNHQFQDFESAVLFTAQGNLS